MSCATARTSAAERSPLWQRVAPQDRLPLGLLVLLSVVFIASGVGPMDRKVWLIENIAPMGVGVWLIATYRRLRMSDRAYAQIAALAMLHVIGSHFTYSMVPLGSWARDTFSLGRNHYDRLVHFGFGFLTFLPFDELLLKWRPNPRPGFFELYVTFVSIAWWSVLYELVEWWSALLVDPGSGAAFLGTQGDPWDAQWDMALACAGALTAALIEAFRNRRHLSGTEVA